MTLLRLWGNSEPVPVPDILVYDDRLPSMATYRWLKTVGRKADQNPMARVWVKSQQGLTRVPLRQWVK